MTQSQRMRDVSHRNPSDPDNVFGRLFRRGPEAATDGGNRAAERDDENDEEDRPVSEQRMRDVDQTPPDEEGARRVWERGGEPPVPEDDEE